MSASEKIVLGWTRDCKGNVVDRHPVEVANAVTAGKRENTQNYVQEPFIVASCGREPQCLTPKRTEYGKAIRKQYEAHKVAEQRKNIQKLEPCTDGVTNTLTSVQKDNFVIEPKCEVVAKLEGGKWDKSLDIMKRVYGENGLAPTQHTVGGGNMETKVQTNYRIRKLTERECFRLMDVSEADIDKIQNAGISRTQQYKMAGNSIVVAVLEAIFDKMFVHTGPSQNQQLSLF